MEKLHQVLCGIEEMLRTVITKFEQEYSEITPSLSVVGNSGEIPQRLAGRNPGRTEIWIHNKSDVDLFIAPVSGEVGADRYSLRIAPDDTLIMNANNYAQLYKKDIYGFWDSGAVNTTAAMVTEFSQRK